MITKVNPDGLLIRFDEVGPVVDPMKFQDALVSLRSSIMAHTIGLEDLKPHEELLIVILQACGMCNSEILRTESDDHAEV